jgi:hypothetical protein
MSFTELMGWAAASMTLLAFTARDLRVLRLASVGASLAFITYGAAEAAWPVLVLHCLLLPVNLLRLRELRRESRGSEVCDSASVGPQGCGCRQSATKDIGSRTQITPAGVRRKPQGRSTTPSGNAGAANPTAKKAAAGSRSRVSVIRSKGKGTCLPNGWGLRKPQSGAGCMTGAKRNWTAAGASIG